MILAHTACESGVKSRDNSPPGNTESAKIVQKTELIFAEPPNHWPESIPMLPNMGVVSSYYQPPLERLETRFSRRDASSPTPTLTEITDLYRDKLLPEWTEVTPTESGNPGSRRLSFTKDNESLDLYAIKLRNANDVHLTVIYSAKGDAKLPIHLGMMPKGWPDDIPLMPSMKLYSGSVDGMGRKIITLIGPTSPKDILEYYIENLEQWEIDREYAGTDFTTDSLTFEFNRTESYSSGNETAIHLEIKIDKENENTWVVLTLSSSTDK